MQKNPDNVLRFLLARPPPAWQAPRVNAGMRRQQQQQLQQLQQQQQEEQEQQLLLQHWLQSASVADEDGSHPDSRVDRVAAPIGCDAPTAITQTSSLPLSKL